MVFPDLNTRQLRRTDDGLFTIESATALERERSICRFCGRDYCPIRRQINSVSNERVGAIVRVCGEFIPVLSFSITAGLDLPRWNTIRLGEAWHKRLEPGLMVAIADTNSRQILRRMRVTETVTMPLPDLCAAHGVNNHAILARPDLHPDDAPAEMMRILRNAYGTTYTSDGRASTAIYLEAP